MFEQMTLEGMSSDTSLPALECGATASGDQAGPTTARLRPRVARASRSLPQGNALEQTTLDTCGLLSGASSASSILSRSLASRLQAKTDLLGSTLFTLTWKVRATPSGRQIYALRASGLRTSGNDCTSWRTPRLNDYKGGVTGAQGSQRSPSDFFLADQANLASWLTPKLPSRGGQSKRESTGGGLRKLEDQALMTSWRSPSASDGEGGVMEIRETADGRYKLRDEAQLASWGSPSACDDRVTSPGVADHKSRLKHQAPLASWPTPSSEGSAGEISEDLERVGSKWHNRKTGRILQTNLATEAKMLLAPQTASGPTPSGSGVPTGSGGRMVLNPSLSRWLMSLPPEWDACAVTATASLRKSRPRSSNPISKSKESEE